MEYNVDYYYNLLKIYTHTAKQINDIRWKFILEHCCDELGNKNLKVLDYGCGVGWFAAFKPGFVKFVDTFDVMPVVQTGIVHDRYDVITMWDVLEHIPDFTKLESILKKTEFVVVSIPIKPLDSSWEDWKHFKPGEHLHYYTQDLLEALFSKFDFSLFHQSSPECPPRKDITTFIFKRKFKEAGP